MSTNPTPPPWEAEDYSISEYNAWRVVARHDVDEHPVAVCTGPNAEQNAKAIAALPGLVHVLRRMEILAETIAGRHSGDRTGANAIDGAKLLAAEARAALVQYRGGA